MSKPQIKIGFDRFADSKVFLMKVLSMDYDVIIDNDSPDLLFCSIFGVDHYTRPGIKVFMTVETVEPNFNVVDYSLSCSQIKYHDRHMYLPPYIVFDAQEEHQALGGITKDLCNRRFANFIYSQCGAGQGSILRRDFCKLLMTAYKHVDCPGRILNNMSSSVLSSRENGESWHASKIRFMSNYKFTIAFENQIFPGYNTEKLIDAYRANTIPIYFGDSACLESFPRESMIYVNDYSSFEELIEKIKEVDSNDELYLSMLSLNPLRTGKYCNKIQEVRAFLKNIILNKNTSRLPESEAQDTKLIKCQIKAKSIIRGLLYPILLFLYLWARCFRLNGENIKELAKGIKWNF